MAAVARTCLALVTVLAGVALPLRAQVPTLEGVPAPLVPPRPLTRQDLDRREALAEYGLGMLCEREDRLIEALRAFEKAARLNPQAAPVFKALVPLYLAMERGDDALRAARKVLDLDPADYQAWYVYARQLRAAGRRQEAITALGRGLACAGVQDRPDLCLQMHHELGSLQERAGNYGEAAAALGEAAKLLERPDAAAELGDLQPDDVKTRAADVYERIGQVCVKAHRLDDAVVAFRKAQAKCPAGAGRLGLNLARVCTEQGKPAEALTNLDAYLRLLPQDAEPYEMKIALLQKLGRSAETVAWLEQAAANDARNVGLKLLLARECGRAGQEARAEQLYRDLAEHSPTPEVYRGLFGLYKASSRLGPARALDLINRTLEQARKKQKELVNNPAPAQARAILAALQDDDELGKLLLRAAVARAESAPGLQPEMLHLLAVLAEHSRLDDEAERFYRRALEGATPESEAAVYGGLLRVLWHARKFEEIVRACEAGLKTAQATNRVLFHSELSRALARLGKLDEAVAQADDSVRLAADADRLMLRQLRVRILVQAGRGERAEAECKALLKECTDPGDQQDVHYLLSNVYSTAGNYPAAVEHLQWILKADAANATACNDLGYLWADQGQNLEEAEKLIRKALDLDRQQRKARPGAGADAGPDNAAYVDSLGWVLFRRGRYEEALQELERAVKLPEGDDPVLWEHLGDVCYRLHQTARAQSAWREAIHLYEEGRRRDRDQRYQDLRHKLEQLEADTP
jgi:tetratricopeptide (TPR) repeat protein